MSQIVPSCATRFPEGTELSVGYISRRQRVVMPGFDPVIHVSRNPPIWRRGCPGIAVKFTRSAQGRLAGHDDPL